MASDQASSFPGHFNDGQTAASREVRVTLGPDGLLFGPENAPAQNHWGYDDLRAVKPMGRSGPAWLSYSGAADARLIVGSPQFASSLLKRAPHVGTAAGHRKTAAIVLACLGGLAALGAIVWVLMSVLPGTIAKAVPESWWASAGANIERSLVKSAKQCHGRDGKEALARLAFKFSGDVESNTVRVYDMALVNAFAMAGGRVVLSNQLIQKAKSAEEVAGVLAHELGHVKAGHPETQLVRVLGLQLIMSALWGGSGVGDLLAQGGAMLSILSYTRAAEREADDTAIELMQKAKIDPRGLARFFESIGDKAKGAGGKQLEGWGSMISTHPGLNERIAKIKKIEIGETEPAMSAEDWRALRAICG